MEKQKKCPVCFSDIDERAIRCPHCQKPQNKHYRLLTHPAVGIAYILVMAAVIIFFFNNIISRIGDKGDEEFSDYRQSISVFDTSIQFGEEETHKQGTRITIPTVFVIGYIENDSPITWSGAVIEVRFFDEQDQLIDTGQTQQYRLVIPERDVCTFKLSYERMLPEEKYNRASAKVIFANEVGSQWPW